MPLFAAQTVIQHRYQIIRLAGQGGMGAVYEAFDQRLRIPVALKQLLLSDPHVTAVFAREAHLLAGLRHSALPRMIDQFEYANHHFLVMEFIPGEDLGALLAKQGRAFPLEQVMQWAEQLLNLLDYLHNVQPPLIHRDIKPQNIKITANNELMLLDFGLAKGSQSNQTAARSLVGYTPQYAPLEQIQGARTDARSDLFAVGATLYHLATGHPPIDALTRAAALVNKQPDPLPASRELNDQIPIHVDAVLMQALSLAADERPASAIVMRQALSAGGFVATGATIQLAQPTAITNETIVVARPAPPAPPISAATTMSLPPARPHSNFIRNMIGIIIAAALIFFVILPRLLFGERHEAFELVPPSAVPTSPVQNGKPIAVIEQVIRQEQIERLVEVSRWGDGSLKKQYVSPDQQWLVYVGTLRMAVLSLPTLEEQVLIDLPAPPANEHTGISPSRNMVMPQGQRIVLRLHDGTARMWSLADGSELATFGGPNDTVMEVALSHDQRTLATLHRTDTTVQLKQWQLDDGKLLKQIELPKLAQYQGLHFHSDHQTVSLIEQVWQPAAMSLMSVNLTTGALTHHQQYDLREQKMALYASHPQLDLMVYAFDDVRVVVEGAQLNTSFSLTNERAISRFIFHPTEPILAIHGRDSGWSIWDLRTQSLLLPLEKVWNVDFSADGSRLVAIGSGEINVWRTADWQVEQTIENNQFGQIFFASDSDTIGLAHQTLVRIWEVDEGGLFDEIPIELFTPHFSEVTPSANGQLVAYIRENQGVDVRQVSDSSLVMHIPASNARTIQFASDNRMLAVGGYGQIQLLDVQERQLLQTITTRENASAISIAFTPDSQAVVVGFDDGWIGVWHLNETRASTQFQAHQESVSQLLVTPDGHSIISSSTKDDQVNIWQFSDGNLIARLQQSDVVYGLSLLSEGEQLAVSSGESVNIWQVEDAKLTRTLPTKQPVWRIASSPNGELLAFVSYDQRLVIWSLPDSRELVRLDNHRERVQALAFTADGRLLISASHDGTVRLWGIP